MKGYLTGLVSGCSLVAVLGWGVARYHPVLNVGRSLGGTVYACRALHAHEPLQRGTVVHYRPPASVTTTLHRIAPGADVRLGWLKQIAATAGDEVCWEQEHIVVNQWRVGVLVLLRDYPLTVPHGTCHVLQQHEVLTMGTDPSSFDGRYTGPMAREEIADVCSRLF